jgi:thiol-disulfide isomerase/thioredoxin
LKGSSHAIGVQLFSDGRFEALDLPPGDHRLQIKIHEPPPDDACGWGRLIAAYSHSFRVSGGPGDAPLDLGVLQPIEQGGQPLKAGDIAPDFAFKTLDGKDLTLASVRGKFFLLDFWATWCAPCVAEIPNLEAVYKAFGSDPRFVMASLSLDERPEDATSFVKSKNLNWHQCIVGPESPVATAYGATAIPATFLIGPDGKILATDLRGEKIMSTINQALKPQTPSPGAPAR